MRGFFPRPSRVRFPAKTSAALIALLAAPLMGGCGQDLPKDDDSFLRTMTEEAPPAAERGASLFPVQPGARWLLDVRDSAERTARTEVLTQKRGGSSDEIVLEARPTTATSESGPPTQRETYIVNKGGVFLRSVSNTVEFRLEPPLPLLRFPVDEGAYYNWTGRIITKGQAVPATGISRVSGREKFPYRADEVMAYHSDAVLSLVINDASAKPQRMTIPMARWFAPNVGLVQQRMLRTDVVRGRNKNGIDAPRRISRQILKIVRRPLP